MATLNKRELEALIADGRRGLLTGFNFSCNSTAAECAEQLTRYAVETGLVESRAALKGATLVAWSKGEGAANAWALTAAAELAISAGYLPRSPAEWAATARYARPGVGAGWDLLLEWRATLATAGIALETAG